MRLMKIITMLIIIIIIYFGNVSSDIQNIEKNQDQYQISYFYTNYNPLISFLSNPENMVDSNLSTYATPIVIMPDSQIQISNTCTGSDLGNS